jgi:hypothetical protein
MLLVSDIAYRQGFENVLYILYEKLGYFTLSLLLSCPCFPNKKYSMNYMILDKHQIILKILQLDDS